MSATSTTESAAAATFTPIDHCTQAFHIAFAAEREKGASEFMASTKGSDAYCMAIPPLNTHPNVLDFIACVAYGMLCHIIPIRDATKLLYASQVALGALGSQPKPEKQKTT
jgi:hypothetical protein